MVWKRVFSAVRARCQPAGVGPTEAVDTLVRTCSATDLLGPGTASTLPPALLHLAQLVDRLRVELAAVCARSLLDVAELQILLYPPGGHCTYAAVEAVPSLIVAVYSPPSHL